MPDPETNRPAGQMQETIIEKWVYGGRGLARVDGRAWLVPFVLPGETVRVEAERERPGLIEGRLVEIVSPSLERRDPRCPYFRRCGGCHYQHAGYEFQLVQKREVLREVLRRVGKLDAPDEIETVSASPWEYRNRVQLHLAGGEIGYLEAASNRLCPVEHCPVSSPEINQALGVLRGMARTSRFPRFVRSLELFTNGAEVQVNVLESARPVARRFFDWCAESIPGATLGVLDYPAAGRVFRAGHRSFFQVNRFLIDELVTRSLESAEGASAVDLYAGVGLFSLALASRFDSVTAVESGASASGDLEFNAARASVEIRVERTTTESYLERLAQPPEFVLADPPRAGLGKTVVRELNRLRPPRLTIVACDPATLARDLAALVAGGYRLERITLVDLFPQTYHLETIAHLSLK
jgi:23S rRNA (uracil1939-C5)-methyltransferase